MAIDLGIARAIGAGAIWLIIAMVALPFVGLMVGFVWLLRLGALISSDLRAAGYPVREACGVRSPADLTAWAERNSVGLDVVAAVGDRKNYNRATGSTVLDAAPPAIPANSSSRASAGLPPWSELMGTDYARRFSSVRTLSLLAAPSPVLIVIALIFAASARISLESAALAGATASAVLITVGVIQLQTFGKTLAADVTRAGYRVDHVPFIRNKGAFILWCHANGLTNETIAQIGRSASSEK